MRPGVIVATAALLMTAAQPIAAQSETPPSSRLAQARRAPASPLERPALLQVERVTLSEALERLHGTSGVGLFYSPSALPGSREVTCECRAATVGEALQRLLAGTGMRYAEVGGHIVLEAAAAPADRSIEPPRLRTVSLEPRLPVIAWQPVTRRQEQVVAGRVVDARSSEPLQSAQVEAVGTGRGTLTDAAGRFRIVGLRGT